MPPAETPLDASGDPAPLAGRRPVVGLTGAIGAGKSLAAAMLAELGCNVIDADRCGHAALERPDVRTALVERFGGGILDAEGRVCRPALAAAAFADPASAAALNAIVHPALTDLMRARLAELQAVDSFEPIILDAALLFESDWWKLCDFMILVDCPRVERLRRVEKRGWDADELDRREKFQIPLDTKRSKVHNILVNSSSESDLREQVRLLHHRLTKPFTR